MDGVADTMVTIESHVISITVPMLAATCNRGGGLYVRFSCKSVANTYSETEKHPVRY
jgi:hypothetical protein